MSSSIEAVWRTKGFKGWLLWPVSLLYRSLMALRRFAYSVGLFRSVAASLPVVVVGNIVVGGTGKTPLTAYLVSEFKSHGWRPGIVSRGYGGQRHLQPHQLHNCDTAEQVGDEPLLLFQQTGVPVCVCVKRGDAVKHLQQHTDCDIIFSDDGLQHLAMQRVAEILVIDGKRGFGNGWLLPAGPLREPISRWHSADVVAVQGSGDIHPSLMGLDSHSSDNRFEHQRFELQLSHTIDLVSEQHSAIEKWRGQSVIAMAGIGNPIRFFTALEQHGVKVIGVAKPDHHEFTLGDFQNLDELPVLVTSKDAVKLRALGELPVEVYEVATRLTVSDALQAAIEQLQNTLNTTYRT